jgi:hypothetical protein
MHVVEELSSSVGMAFAPHGVRHVPVPMVGVEEDVFSPVPEAVLGPVVLPNRTVNSNAFLSHTNIQYIYILKLYMNI